MKTLCRSPTISGGSVTEADPDGPLSMYARVYVSVFCLHNMVHLSCFGPCVLEYVCTIFAILLHFMCSCLKVYDCGVLAFLYNCITSKISISCSMTLTPRHLAVTRHPRCLIAVSVTTKDDTADSTTATRVIDSVRPLHRR